MLTDRQTDVRHINLIGGLITHNLPKNPLFYENILTFWTFGANVYSNSLSHSTFITLNLHLLKDSKA